jgi:predicted XRE-type DNA-binding protein
MASRRHTSTSIGSQVVSGKRKRTTKNTETVEFIQKSGHVFEQLGLPNADDLYRRSHVIQLIGEVIARRRLTQASAGAIAGIDQADVSRLANGSVSRFSLDRLLTIVDRLGINIAIEQRRDAKGQLSVEVREL